MALPLTLALLWAVTGPVAYLDSFSTFREYDDEGYMLLSVRHFLDGYPLYDEIHSGYGPFYYLYKWGLHGMAAVPLTNDGVRFVAIGMWLATASACFLLIFALSRRLSMALLAYAMTFEHLRAFTNEPGHAQELGIALVALSLLVSALAMTGRLTAMSAALGAICAALTLTKTNLGLLLMLGLALAASMAMEHGWLRAVARATPAVAVALPWALMRARLSQPHLARDYFYYCLVVSLSLVSLLLVVLLRRDALIAPRHCLVFAASFAAVAGAICAFAFMKGTSVDGLVNGLVVVPQRLAATFGWPPGVDWRGAAWALASVALAGGYRLARRRLGADAVRLTCAAALAKLALGGAVMSFLRGPYPLYLNYALPLLWVALLPGAHGTLPAREYFPRLVLVCVAVLQTLQAYPVPGSQLAFGTVAIVLVGVLCIADGLQWLETVASRLARGRWLGRAATVAVVLPALCAVLIHLSFASRSYRKTVPLGLPGAERVRTSAARAETYRLLVDTLRTSSDTFLCTTGFNSLYFWTGKPAPNRKVISHELRLFTEAEQHQMVRSLLDHPDAIVIDHPLLFGPRDRSIPLLRDIDREFKPWTHIGPFVLMIRKDRDSAVPLPKGRDGAA